MLFVVFNIDRPEGAEAIRSTVRPAHLAFMKALGDKVQAGGPVLSTNGEKPFGGMYILQADSHQEAVNVAQSDPYVKADLFLQQYVQPWRWNTNRPEGVEVW
ncbi:MAG: YciI family protein [Limnobaculum xujianqingii]|uniref:YciI family protein n=1 Tax=Limnobaculum xujianqingii TaxID=2738837 RepID=UPI00112B9A23|nr:YciI family protein [Limnobaculum xujianqingii]